MRACERWESLALNILKLLEGHRGQARGFWLAAVRLRVVVLLELLDLLGLLPLRAANFTRVLTAWTVFVCRIGQMLKTESRN